MVKVNEKLAQQIADEKEIADTAKLQAAHDIKIKADVDAAMSEAARLKVKIKAGTTNSDAIRKEIAEAVKNRGEVKEALSKENA